MIKGLLLASLLLSMTSCGLLKREPGAKSFVLKKRWVRHTLKNPYLGFRHYHRMTPILTKELVIQGNAIDGLVAYSRKSGHLRWRFDLDGGVEAGAVLDGQSLFFGASNGQFYSIDIHSGLPNWSFPIRSEGLGQAFVQGDRVFFVAGNNILYALDRKKGQQLWQYNRRDPSSLSIRGSSRPNVVGDRLYAGFSDGYLVALDVKTGNLVWEKSLNANKRFRDVDAFPVIEGNRLYVASYDGQIHCLDRNDGRTIWSNDDGGFTAVTLAGKRLYYSTSNGYVVAADKKSGKIIWRSRLKNGVATQPRLYRGLITFGESEGNFQVLDALTGTPVGDYFTGRGVKSSPAIDEKTGEAYFISVNANLYALRLDWVSAQEKWPWEN